MLQNISHVSQFFFPALLLGLTICLNLFAFIFISLFDLTLGQQRMKVKAEYYVFVPSDTLKSTKGRRIGNKYFTHSAEEKKKGKKVK